MRQVYGGPPGGPQEGPRDPSVGSCRQFADRQLDGATRACGEREGVGSRRDRPPRRRRSRPQLLPAAPESGAILALGSRSPCPRAPPIVAVGRGLGAAPGRRRSVLPLSRCRWRSRVAVPCRRRWVPLRCRVAVAVPGPPLAVPGPVPLVLPVAVPFGGAGSGAVGAARRRSSRSAVARVGGGVALCGIASATVAFAVGAVAARASSAATVPTVASAEEALRIDGTVSRRTPTEWPSHPVHRRGHPSRAASPATCGRRRWRGTDGWQRDA